MNDRYAEGFLDGWAAAAETLRTRFTMSPRAATAEATRATVSPAAPDLDPSAPPATRGPQRKPWLTGAQADAAIQRRGMAGLGDWLMRGFAEGDR